MASFKRITLALAACVTGAGALAPIIGSARHRSARALTARMRASPGELEATSVDGNGESEATLALTRRQACVAAAVSAVVTAGGAVVPSCVWAGEGDEAPAVAAPAPPSASDSDSESKSIKVKAAWSATDGFVDEQFISFDEAQYKVGYQATAVLAVTAIPPPSPLTTAATARSPPSAAAAAADTVHER